MLYEDKTSSEQCTERKISIEYSSSTDSSFETSLVSEEGNVIIGKKLACVRNLAHRATALKGLHAVSKATRSCGKLLSVFGKKRFFNPEHSFVCKICCRRFSQQKTLNNHVSTVHENNCAHVCTTCGKSFVRPKVLKRHARTHTKEKPFKCALPGCEKMFNIRSDLTRHINTVHKKIMPHECTECAKVFGKKSHLVEHSRCHSGEKPYKCDLCGRRFTKAFNLRRHILTKHNY